MFCDKKLDGTQGHNQGLRCLWGASQAPTKQQRGSKLAKQLYSFNTLKEFLKYLVMIVVVYPSGKARVVDSDDYELVSCLYNSFVEDATVCTSMYPKPFLRTLPFEKGLCETTTTALWRLFLSWCYSNARKSAAGLWKTAVALRKGKKNAVTEPELPELPELPEAPVFEIPNPEFSPYDISGPGVTVFKKRPLICYELSKEPEQKESKEHPDCVHETSTAAVYFYNSSTKKSGLAFFDKKGSCDERAYLSKIESVGIKDLDVRWVFNLPQTELSYCLAEHYAIETMEPKEQVKTFARILKTVNLQKEKGVFVKGVLEFVYNEYTFDWDSSVPVKSMYEEFCAYNTKRCRFPMNALVGEQVFARLLAYIFFEISGNSVLHVQKRNEEKSVSLDIDNSLAALLKTPHIAMKSHQLRAEPPCTTNYVGPWGMSSQAEFGASDEGSVLSKKLE